MAGFPSPVTLHPHTKTMVPGVAIEAKSHCGHIAGKLVIVPRVGCDHKHTMCQLCIDRWAEHADFLIQDGDPNFDQALAMLERLS